MRFSKNFLDGLTSRLSIVEIVGERVKLTPKKRDDYWGCCPFHHEKSASFHVVESEGFYHCFGCSAHGDVIKFVCETQNLSFVESVTMLAERAGVELPVASKYDKASNEPPRASQLQLMALASQYYGMYLHGDGGKAGIDFLHARGISDQIIHKFELGFAPANQAPLQTKLIEQEADEKALISTGLFKQSDRGTGLYPFFRNRVMIPIHSHAGKVVAFGGRVLPSFEGASTPGKYINSSESTLFSKGEMLFNFHRARKHARDCGELIIAEGYMDVIALDSHGFNAVVAPLGTAVSETQIKQAWKLHDEPIFCFDGDSAGRQAASRAAKLALSILTAGKSVRFVLLPQGEDPDSMLVKKQGSLLREMFDAPIALHVFLFKNEYEKTDYQTPERKSALWSRLLQFVQIVPDALLAKHYRNAFRLLYDQAFVDGYQQSSNSYINGRGNVNGGYASGFKNQQRGQNNRSWLGRNVSSYGAQPVLGRSLKSNLSKLGRLRQVCILAVLGHHPKLMEKYNEDIMLIPFDTDLDFWRLKLQNLLIEMPNNEDSLIEHLACYYGGVEPVKGHYSTKINFDSAKTDLDNDINTTTDNKQKANNGSLNEPTGHGSEPIEHEGEPTGHGSEPIEHEGEPIEHASEPMEEQLYQNQQMHDGDALDFKNFASELSQAASMIKEASITAGNAQAERWLVFALEYTSESRRQEELHGDYKHFELEQKLQLEFELMAKRNQLHENEALVSGNIESDNVEKSTDFASLNAHENE